MITSWRDDAVKKAEQYKSPFMSENEEETLKQKTTDYMQRLQKSSNKLRQFYDIEDKDIV
jgi:hypothetical protein